MRPLLALAVLALSGWFLIDHGNPSPAETLLRDLVRQERGRKAYAGNLAPLEAGEYRFGALTVDENGRPMDPKTRFAYWAAPKGKGRTYLVDETGTVYAKDTEGRVPRWWPASDPTAKGWVAITP